MFDVHSHRNFMVLTRVTPFALRSGIRLPAKQCEDTKFGHPGVGPAGELYRLAKLVHKTQVDILSTCIFGKSVKNKMLG